MKVKKISLELPEDIVKEMLNIVELKKENKERNRKTDRFIELRSRNRLNLEEEKEYRELENWWNLKGRINVLDCGNIITAINTEFKMKKYDILRKQLGIKLFEETDD